MEVLAFDTADVALSKYTSAERPMCVFEGRIIQVLASNDERAKENTFAGPLLECNLEVGLGAVDVHESDQERRDRHLCASEDIGRKGGERAVVGVAREGPPTLGRGRTPHCIVDCVCHSVDDILDDGPGQLDLEELEESGGVESGIDEAGPV